MSNPLSLAIVMDPIAEIYPRKDTSLALLLEAAARGWKLHYLEIQDLFLKEGVAWGRVCSLEVFDSEKKWYNLGMIEERPLDQFDVILMRKDPPVTMDYIYATHILEQAASSGVLVVNDPQSLRDINEKMATLRFPGCVAPTLVSASRVEIQQFVEEHREVVLKPLAEMGGRSVFKSGVEDPNLAVIIETLTEFGHRYAMVQQFIPAVYQGDKRIILIEGEPIPLALARIPREGTFRANLAAGGQGELVGLTERDRWICEQVRPFVQERGLLLVGLDVIGDYLTEINITSPTCVREIEAQGGINITGNVLDAIMDKLEA